MHAGITWDAAYIGRSTWKSTRWDEQLEFLLRDAMLAQSSDKTSCVTPWHGEYMKEQWNIFYRTIPVTVSLYH